MIETVEGGIERGKGGEPKSLEGTIEALVRSSGRYL